MCLDKTLNDAECNLLNATGVRNVKTVPNVPQMTKKDPSVPKKQCTNWSSVPTGVPNVQYTKVHQIYQNSLRMKPSVLKH